MWDIFCAYCHCYYSFINVHICIPVLHREMNSNSLNIYWILALVPGIVWSSEDAMINKVQLIF